MASTQKKTTKKKKAPPKPEPPAYNGLARLVGGVVCLLLALCVLVSYFQVDALLLTFIAKVLKGTLGYGYFLAAPALLAVAVIQLRHQGRPVILRTTCTLLVPLLSGMLCHLLLCRTAYELGSGLLPQLWKDGQTLTCGGVVAGGLALGSEALLSKVVSVVVFVVLLVAALLFITATNSTAGLASVQALVCGRYAVVFWVLFVAVGLVIPTVLETKMLFFSPKEFEESRKAHMISAGSDIGVLIGGFVLRLLVLLAAVAALYFVDSTAFEGLLPSVMSALSLFERFYTFVNGVFDLTAVFYYLTVAALFLFLSVQSLEKRRYN